MINFLNEVIASNIVNNNYEITLKPIYMMVVYKSHIFELFVIHAFF